MTENKELTVETSELVELVNGKIPEGKRIVRLGSITHISIHLERSESPSEALKRKIEEVKLDWPTHYMKTPTPLLERFGGEMSYTFAVQFLKLEDNPNYKGEQ